MERQILSHSNIIQSMRLKVREWLHKRRKGEGYSPENGRYYKAHLRANGGKMTMKGCVSVFCRTVTWTKMS